MKPSFHVDWKLKLAAFIASVMSLSWFFAGWRQIHEETGWAGWLTLAGGIATTLLLLALQGYWIYFDEKKKGALRRRIELYERIHAALNGGSEKVALAWTKGESDSHE